MQCTYKLVSQMQYLVADNSLQAICTTRVALGLQQGMWTTPLGFKLWHSITLSSVHKLVFTSFPWIHNCSFCLEMNTQRLLFIQTLMGRRLVRAFVWPAWDQGFQIPQTAGCTETQQDLGFKNPARMFWKGNEIMKERSFMKLLQRDKWSKFSRLRAELGMLSEALVRCTLWPAALPPFAPLLPSCRNYSSN